MSRANWGVIDSATVTIAVDASLSGALDLQGGVLVGIVMPAAWTAAALTFQGSLDNVTFNDLYDSGGTELNYTVGASRLVAVNPDNWHGVRHIKVRSGTTGTPVNQAAARTLTLAVAKLHGG